MSVFITLIGFSILAFGVAYFLRNKQLDNSIYDAISAFGAAVILGVLVFDFLPHLFNDFPFLSPDKGHNHHDHHGHDHHHHTNSTFSWAKLALFSGLVIIGFFAQLALENWVIKKQKHAFADWILVIGLFLHSFSEVALLHDQSNHLNQSLFLGILFHKVPVAFILAYTLIKDFGIKKAIIGFGVFMLSIPLGLLFNDLMSNAGTLFNVTSVIITGMILHVLWHMIEHIKTKTLLNWVMIALGLMVGYSVTLFHAH